MTICPIALAVGCLRCALFTTCPLIYVLGDQKKEDNATFPNIEHKEENKKEESKKEESKKE